MVAVRPTTYAGLFMVTLATLLYELLLTRIFSVTMWYHFAFMAVSVAMFGMTVGAIIVYLRPAYFTESRVGEQLANVSLLFALTVIFSFLTHLAIPFAPNVSLLGIYSVALTYVVIAVPFVFSGIAVCLALTRFPAHVNRLYAADLLGAALGCVLFIYILRITDGPTAVVIVALLAALGSVLFAVGSASARRVRLAGAVSLLLALTAVGGAILSARQTPLLRLAYVKGQVEEKPLYDKWNSFSRVAVFGDPERLEAPFGWGLSYTYPTERKVHQMLMNIDATAGTPLTKFSGDLGDIEHLKYDVTNLVHYIRPNAKVLVVGTGGGRDLLSALAFRQRAVVGVEINPDIIAAVNGTFGDFTGHLDRNPAVTFVNDEARSYVARQRERFDIIQVSLIDTWAATAAGAFVFTENSLYTEEAWKLFLERLNSSGVLTFSRWYFRDRPGEVYRLTSLAMAALKQLRVNDPRQHVIIVRRMMRGAGRNGVGTILVGREPFSTADLERVEQVAQEMQFEVVLSPRQALDPIFTALATGRDPDGVVAKFPLNVSAPTDDSPFFFHMLRSRDLLRRELWQHGEVSFNMKAMFILATLFVVVTVLTLACVIVPLLLTTERGALRGAFPFFVFFAAIGVGFMLIEISQMQRLIVFLGHPTYGLSVVLFSLLLSSGLGSYATQLGRAPGAVTSPALRLGLLLAVLIIFGLLTPSAITWLQESSTAVRIVAATAILLPLGFFMGMAFPLGMQLASAHSAAITPWLWGINGATSVCASVLALVIALTWGIAAAFWTGFACYVAATLALTSVARRA
ncbi:MAG: hypothetical protein HY699_25340 [Deltaproteobacteria bacterium]|nr:hypothetical protein [Deltaproteobacteria bacterium]